MYSSSNELYIVFSFVGFVVSAIPLYWHLEARNMGTSLYMIWTGLACFFQCVSSIIWNKNMTDRFSVYCEIAIRIQIAQNVAVPACSLCINRRLYKIAMAKAAKATKAEKRRTLIQDLLIGVGIPILQMVTHYIASSNRYDIFEDYGPRPTFANTPLAPILVNAWPVAIGTVSFYYCTRTIYTLYKRQLQFRQFMASSQGFSSSLYIRLMIISSAEILATIPLGTYILVTNVKEGVGPWESWASMHSHYSVVNQIPGSVWKNDRQTTQDLDMFRWLLVGCAFIFFAFFGFAEEARQNYRRVYTSLASRIGYPKSILRASSHATSSVPSVDTRRNGGVKVSLATTRGERHITSASLTDELSIQSIFVPNDPKPKSDFEIELGQDSPLNSVISPSVESFDESGMRGRSNLPAEIMPTVPPASVPPHLPYKTKSNARACSGIDAV